MSDRSRNRLTQQADQLYARGVAAARGGQKTVAATLLRQTVKLNPQHEQAWLWLSGVLDQPEDVAFCLRAVLGINPANERAERGLAWIEQQAQHATPAEQPAPTGRRFVPPIADANWWSTWRTKQSTWLWTLRALLLIPIILLAATLGVRTLIESQPLPAFATYRDLPVPTALPSSRAVVLPTATAVVPTATSRAAVVSYFDTINRERHALQGATATYRTTTDGSRTTVERVMAANQLRDQVERSHGQLSPLQPPTEVAAAHQLYLEGLAAEQEALDQVLEFYRSYDVALANRAALRLQEARGQIATATATWEAFAEQHSLKITPAGTR